MNFFYYIIIICCWIGLHAMDNHDDIFLLRQCEKLVLNDYEDDFIIPGDNDDSADQTNDPQKKPNILRRLSSSTIAATSGIISSIRKKAQ